MKKILCYGDSNTYGFDPRSYLGDRYRKNERWTGILDASKDFTVINFGQNGREIPTNRWSYGLLLQKIDENPDLSALVIMLGTNDVIFHRNMTGEKLRERMDFLLKTVLEHPVLQNNPEKLLLLAPPQPRPPYFNTGVLNEEPEFPDFCEIYSTLADQYHIRFASVEEWNPEFAVDGVHFTPEGHRIFAENLQAILV